MVMTLVVFAMTIFLTIYSFLMKQSQNQERAVGQPSPPRGANSGSGMRLHFLIVFLIFVVLVFSVPLTWMILGQGGMPLVKLATILLLWFRSTELWRWQLSSRKVFPDRQAIFRTLTQRSRKSI